MSRLPKRPKTQTSQSAAARLLADPCKAPLTTGLFGTKGGCVSRLHKSFQAYQDEVLTSWVAVLWVPSTKGGACTGSGQLFNLMSWSGTPGVQLNNVGEGYGQSVGNNDNNLSSYADPELLPLYGYTTIDQSTTQSLGIATSSRTLGACLKATFVGYQSSMSGMVYPIVDMPLEALADRPTLNQLRQYCSEGSREFTHEVKWKPTHERDAEFKGVGDLTNLMISSAAVVTATAPTFIKNIPERAIGFLFVNVDMSTIIIDAYKVVEWQPKIATGMQLAPPEQAQDQSVYTRIVRNLDKAQPNWRDKAFDYATNAAINLIGSIAYAGVGRRTGVGGARTIMG